MSTGEIITASPLVQRAVSAANRAGRPLYLVVLATKPCYIKLASLIFALGRAGVPSLLVDANQHYDFPLVNVREEFRYQHLIGVHLNIRGDLLGRTADLAQKLRLLHDGLRAAGLREPAIPVVSGDTSTAGFVPAFWYLLSGQRSVHVEAGLRSSGPAMSWQWQGLGHLLSQRSAAWRRFRDEPFPEGIDTTLASVACDLLLAPVRRNADNLLGEGYEAEKVHVVGSLSADAVRLAAAEDRSGARDRAFTSLPPGKWLRVDLHRRENMTSERLTAVLGGIARFSDQGGRVLLISTNALRSALKEHGMADVLPELERRHGLLVQGIWASYFDVVEFMKSAQCLALFTDSGGLQEEAHVLGVPCITCRYSTDRPETVSEGLSNLLLPPDSDTLIAGGLEAMLGAEPRRVWPGLPSRTLYGEGVGERIAQLLSEYVPPPPARGSGVVF
jgi:UDP-N-acetylglucosamine 2-epimerase